MSDLISRQDAIDVLDVLFQEHRYKIPGKAETYSQYNEAWQDALDRAEGAIGNLPSADRPQEWIPCSEKLPSENDDYLVTLENGVVKILGYSTTQRTTYPKGFYHIKDGFSLRQIQNPVVAWMPLPTPYKEGTDE